MRLSELGEFGLLAELERRGLAQRIDADGAELGDGLVLTQDVLVEGIHFRREWASWRDLGYKAAAVNLSDLAALAAEPVALFVVLAAPGETGADALVELYEGLNEPGVPVRGGDTAASPVLSISVTAVGRSERVPGRSGAQPGDVLVVTGPLGGSAAGLRALERGLDGFDELVQAHNRPPFRLAAGRELGPVAHALLDLSDGIASDARRIAERSGCRLVVDVERLPLAPRIAEVGDEPFWTLGEDYELLAALAPEDAKRFDYPVIGRVEEGKGVELLRDGRRVDLEGWNHFRRPE
ncbi:MAG TPA: thiamine-phosphate kinase [Gaiellaceae bacterium]